MQKPILIDEWCKGDRGKCETEINGRWYVAKPLTYFTWRTFVTNIYHCGLILLGRAFAVQFMEDRYRVDGEKPDQDV